jgi:predicted methyltransferase
MTDEEIAEKIIERIQENTSIEVSCHSDGNYDTFSWSDYSTRLKLVHSIGGRETVEIDGIHLDLDDGTAFAVYTEMKQRWYETQDRNSQKDMWKRDTLERKVQKW